MDKKEQKQLIHSFIYFLLYTGLIFFFTALPIPVLVNFGSNTINAETIQANSIYLICHLFIAILGGMLFFQRFKEDFFAMMALHKKALTYIGIFFLIFMIGNLLHTKISPSENELSFLMMGYTLTKGQIPFYVIIFLVTGPMTEALVYEEIIINQLSRYLPTYGLCLFSALLFMIAHLSLSKHLFVYLSYFIILLGINFIYIKTNRNIWLLTLGHIFNNTLIFLTLI